MEKSEINLRVSTDGDHTSNNAMISPSRDSIQHRRTVMPSPGSARYHSAATDMNSPFSIKSSELSSVYSMPAESLDGESFYESTRSTWSSSIPPASPSRFAKKSANIKKSDSQAELLDPESLEIEAYPQDLNKSGRINSFYRFVPNFFKGRSKKFWALFSIATIFFLLIISLIIAYSVIWKGIPGVEVIGIREPGTGSQNNNLNVDLGGGQRSPSLTMLIFLNLAVTNPNLIDLSFERIDINAFHPKVPGLQIGKANITNLNLPKQSRTPLTLEMYIDYNLSDDPSGSIPNDLVLSCTREEGNSSPDQPLTLDFALRAKVKLTDEIRFDIGPFNNQASFTCPLNLDRYINIGGVTIALDKIDWKALAMGQLSLLS